MNTGETTDMPMGNLETQQITTFADDSALVTGAKLGITSVPSWKSFAEESRSHNIIDILSRPVLLTDSSSIWTTSASRNQFPTASYSNSVFSFPNAIFNKSSNIISKIQNFAYFRADVKIRIMVNAQAFSQGKLWIWFSPYEITSGTQSSADNLAAKTGYPGVELDVAAGTPVEFSIPYCAPQSHYALTSGEGTMGDLFLTVLSPLTVSDASLSVFAWFENIDLQLPTGAARGILPSPYFNFTPADAYTSNANVSITSSLWGGSVLTFGNTSSRATLTKSVIGYFANGNIGIIPKGTSVHALAAPTSPSSLILVTPTGFAITIITGLTTGTFTVGFKSEINPTGFLYTSTDYNPSTSETFILSSGTCSPTLMSYPLTFVGAVGVPSTLANPTISVNPASNSIYILPAITQAIYTTITGSKFIGNSVVSGFSLGTPTVTQNNATYNVNNTNGAYFAWAQSDNKDEDDWYKNYPRAQANESESMALSGLITNGYKTLKSASQVPMLSSLVQPLSWISRIGSLVGAGYSKPTDVEKPHCVYNVPAKGFTHGENADYSVNLGLIPDNSIGVEPGVFASTIDELDIAYVAKKSCYLRTDPWTNNSTGKIFSIFVSPGISTIVGSLYQPTLLAYLSSMFKFWHGGLRYRISVAKTGFHTGRLRISYHPGAYILSTTYPSDNAYSWILDLSVSSEIDIEIPYVTTKPWLISDLFDQNSVNPYGPTNNLVANIGSNNLNFSTGILQIEVLNQLRVAGAASNTVEILTWISGNDDIRFSVPNFTSFRPCNSQTVMSSIELSRFKRSIEDFDEEEQEQFEEEQPQEELKEEVEVEEVDESEIEAQAFQNTSDANSHLGQLDGSAFSRMFSAGNSFTRSTTLTMGEDVTNLRVLLKRFTPFIFKNGSTATISPNKVVIDPAYFGILTSGTSAYDVPIKIFNGSSLFGSYTNCQAPIEYISKIYRFYRGSRRYKAVVGNANTGDTSVMNFCVQGYLDSIIQVNGTVQTPQILSVTEDPSTTFSTSGRFAHWVDGVNNKVCEVSVPYYSATPIQVISDGTQLLQNDDYAMRFNVVFDSGPTATNNSKQVVIYQAAGDDFNFGYLIGAPLLKRVELVADFN